MIATLVRRLGGLGLALGLACGLLASPATAPDVRAAAPDLTIVTDARYDVQPEQHRVRVNVTVVLTNHLKDTVTKRYYFDRAFLAVLPNTSGFKFTWEGSGTPEVHVSEKTADYTLLRLDLGQRLFSGKSATYKLRFDLVDRAGADPGRAIGETLASFPVWAFATDATPGGNVKVIFPAGFDVDVEAGEIPNRRPPRMGGWSSPAGSSTSRSRSSPISWATGPGPTRNGRSRCPSGVRRSTSRFVPGPMTRSG
jgi:hypothetical protein